MENQRRNRSRSRERDAPQQSSNQRMDDDENKLFVGNISFDVRIY
jgi:hypothetical protein